MKEEILISHQSVLVDYGHKYEVRRMYQKEVMAFIKFRRGTIKAGLKVIVNLP